MAKFLIPAGVFADAAIPVTLEEHYALRALEQGTAIAGQQQLALKCIIEKIAGYYELSIRGGPEGRRETDFNEGRRFVGAHIIHELKHPWPEKPVPIAPASKRRKP